MDTLVDQKSSLEGGLRVAEGLAEGQLTINSMVAGKDICRLDTGV